jgi:mRNA interferase RelE/StbE
LAWQIEFDPAALNDLSKLDRQIQKRITNFLHERLENIDNPRNIGGPLRGEVLGRFWKYRVGDYRLVCDIKDKIIKIIIINIGHRKEVYR